MQSTTLIVLAMGANVVAMLLVVFIALRMGGLRGGRSNAE